MDRKTMTDRDLAPGKTQTGERRTQRFESDGTERATAHQQGLRDQIREAADQNDAERLHRIAATIEGGYDATGHHRYIEILDECQTAAAVVAQTTRDSRG